QIAAAALAIADAEGFEQVTMRRVAARLTAGTMTLYHYVHTTHHLVALMDDELISQLLVSPEDLSKGWRESISAIARRTRAILAQHPWAMVSMRSAPPGPRAMEHFEQCLTALAHAPLAPADKLVLLGCVVDLAFGSALRSGPPARPPRRTGWSCSAASTTSRWAARCDRTPPSAALRPRAPPSARSAGSA